MIECLGLSTARSQNIIKMAKMWLEEPPTPDKVYKSRVTAIDSMKLFCFCFSCLIEPLWMQVRAIHALLYLISQG